jgi:hypothetical protein
LQLARVEHAQEAPEAGAAAILVDGLDLLVALALAWRTAGNLVEKDLGFAVAVEDRALAASS